MEKDKLITVVIPVYNRAQIVLRTLESIKAQTSTDFRLVIVDNASTDNTLDVLTKWVESHSEYPFQPTLLTESKAGASAARNCGLKRVNTRYVMFFDSDDEMRPTHMARISDHLRRFPETELLRWNTSMIDPDGWLTTQEKRFHDEMQLHLLHSTLSTQRFVVCTHIMNQIGGWDENLSTFDDVEMGVRLIASGCKIKELHGEPTVLIHRSEESITGPDYTSRIEEIKLSLNKIETILRENELSEDLRILNAKRAIVAGHLKREKNNRQAQSLLEQAQKSANSGDRPYLRLVYHTIRIFGKGGCFLALKLMGKKREKH